MGECLEGNTGAPHTRIPSATGILRLRTAPRGEGSEVFAAKGGIDITGRPAANIDQSHAKKIRAIVARTHG